MKIKRIIQKIVNEIEKSKILTILFTLIVRMRCVLLDRRGTGETEAVADVLCGALAMQNIVIGGVSYLVRTHFREDTTTTAVDKIVRLIEKDAESSQ